MTRVWRLLAQIAVLGALTLVAFPSDGSALLGVFPITLTPSGPSPDVATLTTVGVAPVWVNNDHVTHTVVFANGRCTLQLAPGAQGACTNDFWAYVGRYPYSVDGVQGSLVVVPAGRSVTLTARSHTIERGALLRLHGTLTFASDLPLAGPSMPVFVVARPDRHQPFRFVAMATERVADQDGGFPWELYVRPKTTTIYIAEVYDQPDGGQVWQQASSSPFKIVVRRVRSTANSP